MPPNRSDWIVIGIAGVTCGGKTTLANRLQAALSPAQVFHQDKYFYPDDSPNHVRCENLEHNNYDILSALDMKAMTSDVLQAMSTPPPARGKGFLIVEGFTVLNHAPLTDLCDLRYYFILEYEECLARRVFRLYDPPDVQGYFERCVWPEHIKYRAEIETDCRVTLLDGMRPDAFDVVMADLKALGATEIGQ